MPYKKTRSSHVKNLHFQEQGNRWQQTLLWQLTFSLLACHTSSNFLSLLHSNGLLTFPFGNKTTQTPRDKSTDEWNQWGRRPGEDSGGLLWADTSWWDDGVVPALLYTLIIRRCLEGTLSKRLMRSCLRGNKSDLAGVRGRASHSHGM